MGELQSSLQADDGLRAKPEDEYLPFLSNFQDIFLTIGLVIFLGGVGLVAGIFATGSIPDSIQGIAFFVAMICLAITVVVLLLSEVLVRARRRILPGIVLCLTFLVLILGAFTGIYGGLVGENLFSEMQSSRWESIGESIGDYEEGGTINHEVLRGFVKEIASANPWSVKLYDPLSGVVVLLASLFFYKRYRLPFASGMVGVNGLAVVSSLLFLFFTYDAFRFLPTIVLMTGVLLMFAGIGYDMKDPQRETRFSGNGFWLHFFAAPSVLFGSLMVTKFGFAFDIPALINGGEEMLKDVFLSFSVEDAVATLIVIGGFAFISLLLNRRALVVSGLVWSAIAIGYLFSQTGLGAMEIAAVTMVLLGGGVLLLGIGWNAARSALLVFVPRGGVFGRIFPRETVDG